jgi:hypothetical protein
MSIFLTAIFCTVNVSIVEKEVLMFALDAIIAILATPKLSSLKKRKNMLKQATKYQNNYL